MLDFQALINFLKKHKTTRGRKIMYDIKGYHKYLTKEEAINHFFKHD